MTTGRPSSDSVRARFDQLGITLPQGAPAPAGVYVPAVVSAPFVYTAGQLPLRDGALLHSGIVGADVSLEEATACARLCAINAIVAAGNALGSLERIGRVVKVVGFVASAPTFTAQATVLNGASELIGAVFGDAGVHARSAVGVAVLPLSAPVEVELIIELA